MAGRLAVVVESNGLRPRVIVIDHHGARELACTFFVRAECPHNSGQLPVRVERSVRVSGLALRCPLCKGNTGKGGLCIYPVVKKLFKRDNDLACVS